MEDKKQKPISFAKLVQGYDEDFKLCDFTPQELAIILNRQNKSNQKFKDDYFSFYNDVKSSSLKKQDW